MINILSTPRVLATARLGRELLDAHGLPDWSFRFNKSKVNMGLCRFDPKVIELSVFFVERNSEELIRDTLLHEIAHALVGPGHGHDEVWKRVCVRVGAEPARVSFKVNMPDGRWQAICGHCGLVHHKHRKPKRMRGWFCQACGPQLGRLDWTQVGPQSSDPFLPDVSTLLGQK